MEYMATLPIVYLHAHPRDVSWPVRGRSSTRTPCLRCVPRLSIPSPLEPRLTSSRSSGGDPANRQPLQYGEVLRVEADLALQMGCSLNALHARFPPSTVSVLPSRNWGSCRTADKGVGFPYCRVTLPPGSSSCRVYGQGSEACRGPTYALVALELHKNCVHSSLSRQIQNVWKKKALVSPGRSQMVQVGFSY